MEALKKDGLSVEGPRGDWKVKTVATDNPADLDPVDVVLFCVKLWDVESAGAAIRPLVGPQTAVIPLQNGIDAPERLALILGEKVVMGGVAQISASITAPGVVTQVGTFMRMLFGELDGSSSARGEALLAMCRKAGFEAVQSDQIVTELWLKFILLATNASVMAMARQPIGKLRDDPDMRPQFIAAYNEVIAVGRARGVKLPAGLKQCQKLPAPIFTPSTKAERGTHDENISFEEAAQIIGPDRARYVRDKSIEVFQVKLKVSQRFASSALMVFLLGVNGHR